MAKRKQSLGKLETAGEIEEGVVGDGKPEGAGDGWRTA